MASLAARPNASIGRGRGGGPAPSGRKARRHRNKSSAKTKDPIWAGERPRTQKRIVAPAPLPQSRYSIGEEFHYEWGDCGPPAVSHLETLRSERAASHRRMARRLCRGPISLSLAACFLASCAIPESIFRFGGAPAIFEDPAHVRHSEEPMRRSGAVAQSVDLHGSRPPIAATAAHATPASQPIGVGFKPARPLAEIRKQLARLLQNGAMAVMPDERISDGVSSPDEQYFVQIGSYQMRSAAERHWGGATNALSTFITGFDLRIRPAHISGQGNFFRVQIGPLASQGAALDLCRALKAQQQACFTVAEKDPPPADTVAHVPLSGGWASIAPGANSQLRHAGLRDRPRVLHSAAPQVADAAPLYTAPGMPGLPE